MLGDLKPYVPKRFPSIKGGEGRFIVEELQRISACMTLLIQELTALEVRVAANEKALEV